MTDFRHHVNKILQHSTDKFGEEVTFYPKCGGVYKVRGIFNNEYASLDVDTEQLLSATQPSLGVNLNDIKFDLQQGDQVQIRETRFKVVDKQPDGQGGAMLMLHKVSLNERLRDTRAR